MRGFGRHQTPDGFRVWADNTLSAIPPRASRLFSSLSVLRLAEDGSLTPVDHIIDDLGTRVQNITAIETVAVGDRVYLHAWDTGSEAKAGIRKWMTFYNHQRPHSALGGRPPAVEYWLRKDETQPDQQVQRVA